MYRLAKSVVRIGACAVVVLLLAGASQAEAARCSVSTSSMVFGTYNVFSASPVDSTATITYRCTGNAEGVLVTITNGQSATFIPRQLAKGQEKLSYNLFRDAARTSIWGDFTGGTSALIDSNPPNNKDVNVTVFGRIPPGQDISAGSYSDTVTVVVLY